MFNLVKDKVKRLKKIASYNRKYMNQSVTVNLHPNYNEKNFGLASFGIITSWKKAASLF